MYRCSEIVRFISTDEYMSVGFFKKLRIRIHLAMCRNCSKYLRQVRAMGAALREGGGTVPPSEIETARKQILENLSGKQ